MRNNNENYNQNERIYPISVMNGYAGAPAQIEVKINGIRHIVEHNELERILSKTIDNKDYTSLKLGKQRIARLISL